MKACRIALAAMLVMASATPALAQSPDLQPGVQTSPTPTPTVPPAAPQPQAQPPAASKAAPAPTAQTAAKPGTKSQDRIELDTTQISGNRELPKVMYVVPWRKANPGDFAGRPPNSLLDEALTPVDRDVFRRQNRYYAALEAGPAASGAATSQSSASGAKVEPPESKDEK